MKRHTILLLAAALLSGLAARAVAAPVSESLDYAGVTVPSTTHRAFLHNEGDVSVSPAAMMAVGTPAANADYAALSVPDLNSVTLTIPGPVPSTRILHRMKSSVVPRDQVTEICVNSSVYTPSPCSFVVQMWNFNTASWTQTVGVITSSPSATTVERCFTVTNGADMIDASGYMYILEYTYTPAVVIGIDYVQVTLTGEDGVTPPPPPPPPPPPSPPPAPGSPPQPPAEPPKPAILSQSIWDEILSLASGVF
jgi:hypothetical protein